jgi:phosphoenolpyruvate phosphomutase
LKKQEEKPMKKSSKLKKMLQSGDLEFLMEAHNGLSARIVEETGFSGIWASGLSLSAALGVRDNNEASWTQILEQVEFMSDATTIPILLDGDTGYGNFNNMRRLVKKLEQRNVAGVCIEDKLFPKTNSFIGGEKQPLANIEEFAGKIKAAKDTQTDEDFVVVARVESFIAGWGLEETLKRAEAYRQAGADAILIHSKKPSHIDIELFMNEWQNRHPIVIVPTKYFSTPTDTFRDLGISTVIWANHNCRSAIQSMKKTSQKIFEDQSLINVEDDIASVSDIFSLQGAPELKEAEKKYLPATNKNINAIVLAASQGKELEHLTVDTPKTLLKVKGKTILSRLIEGFNKFGIKDIAIVRGFEKEKIAPNNTTLIDNNKFETTKDLYSLFSAESHIKGDTIISYGDIVYKSHILHSLLNDSNDISIIVDTDYSTSGRAIDYVKTDTSHSEDIFHEDNVFLKDIFTEEGRRFNADAKNAYGEFIGLWKVNENGAKAIKVVLQKFEQQNTIEQATITDLLNELKKDHPINVKYIKGSWMDIDTIVDLQTAGEI